MLFDDTYKSISVMSSGLYKEKGSKFIALAYPATTEGEVKDILKQLRKEYYDATHHCYAYILGPDKSATRANDDGEPSGTAGKPIQGQIQSFDLTNVLVVVIRYYGGTKLGVSGLIHAYRTAAKEALQLARIIELTVKEHYRIKFPYILMNSVMQLAKEEDLDIQGNEFDEDATIFFSVRRKNAEKVLLKFKYMQSVTITFLYNS
jgi:uncharacterized YigZ family protein